MLYTLKGTTKVLVMTILRLNAIRGTRTKGVVSNPILSCTGITSSLGNQCHEYPHEAD